MSEWKPIETAPRDGTWVLVCCMKTTKYQTEKLGYMAVDRWNECTGWGKFNRYHWPATHWQPLPAPPTN